MKILRHLSALFALLVVASCAFTQSPPQGISYQAVARDGDGSVLTSATLVVRMGILANETIDVWTEDHEVTTDQFGLFSLIIGQGDFVSGNAFSFDLIQWGSAEYWLQVEIDPGDGIWELIGTSQMLSVPYALYAGNALGDDDGDPTNELITSMTMVDDSLVVNEGGVEFFVDLGETFAQNNTDECITLFQLVGNNLNLVECGEAHVIDLTPLLDDGDWQMDAGVVYNSDDFVGIGTASPTSHFEVTGSVAYEVSQVTGPINVNLDENNHVIIADVTNADVTINLPSANSCYGREYVFKIFSSGFPNDLILLTDAVETVDGQDDPIIGSDNLAFTIISDGVNWWVINGDITP